MANQSRLNVSKCRHASQLSRRVVPRGNTTATLLSSNEKTHPLTFLETTETKPMASASQPILSRLDRLDAMMGYLEEMKGCNKSEKSSCESTASSGMVTTTSNGGSSSANSSPKSLEKRCRPIDSVMMETQVKGSLVDRLVLLETRLMKLSLILEEEIKVEKEEDDQKKQKRRHRKGLKHMVKSCVGSNPRHTN